MEDVWPAGGEEANRNLQRRSVSNELRGAPVTFGKDRQVAILVLILLALHINAQSVPPRAFVATDAYPIYNAVLTDHVGADPQATLSIVRSTAVPDLSNCIARARNSAQWASAVSDLRRRNTSSSTIEEKFALPFKWELADSMEPVGGLRPPPPGKDPVEFLREQTAALEDMGRGHYSQVQLSVPGISADGQLAIVYLQISFAGDFRVLQQTNATWTVKAPPLCGWIA
jgi:hypothetical protein